MLMRPEIRKGFAVHFIYYSAWSLFYPILSLVLIEHKHMTNTRAAFFVSTIAIITLILGPSITASSQTRHVQALRYRIGIVLTGVGLVMLAAVPRTLAGVACIAMGLGKAHLDGPLRLTLMSKCAPHDVAKRIFGRQVSFYLASLAAALFLYLRQDLVESIWIATGLLFGLFVFSMIGSGGTHGPIAKLDLKIPPVKSILRTYPPVALALVSGLFFTAGLGAHQAIGLNAFVSGLGKNQAFFVLGSSTVFALLGMAILSIVRITQSTATIVGAVGGILGFGLMATGSSLAWTGGCVAGCALVSLAEIVILSSMEKFIVSLSKNDDFSKLVGVADLRYLGFGLGPPLGAFLLSHGSHWFFLGCGFLSAIGCAAQALCIRAHPTCMLETCTTGLAKDLRLG